MNSNLIGIFDSGVGGLTIWSHINHLLPNEPTVYISDNKNSPYGNKSRDEIIHLSIKNTKKLIQEGCKTIIVACNTATSNAIPILREKHNIPFIGIEPAIKPATLQTKTNTIGVLATEGTLVSDLFHKTSLAHTQNIKMITQNGNGLVDLIESGMINSEKVENLLHKYLSPMVNKGIDCLVLGCTHYPLLIPIIRKIIPPQIHIIDSGVAVAKQTKHILENLNLSNVQKPISHKFICTGSNKTLSYFVKDIVHPKQSYELITN